MKAKQLNALGWSQASSVNGFGEDLLSVYNAERKNPTMLGLHNGTSRGERGD